MPKNNAKVMFIVHRISTPLPNSHPAFFTSKLILLFTAIVKNRVNYTKINER
ncbi:MAG: hypothetical protein FD155_2856 [Bacteroidetes bacterium]|nr:MAG: hypothetical protein FD155_2856 [Bacteroidota bacterium]